MDLLARRRMLMAGTGSAPLPYDSRVLYLEGDGSSYIDTGVNLRSICVAHYGMDFSQVPPSVSTPFGIWWDGSGPRNQAAYINQVWKDNYTSYTITEGVSSNQAVAVNTPYDLVATSRQTYANDNTNYFYARHNDGGSPLPTKYMRGRYLAIEQNSSFALDAYPVRVGSVGYYYDRVSRTLLPNIGGGAFSLGTDTDFTLSKMASSSMTSGGQGLAIYGNTLVRMYSSSTTHRIYSISSTGGLTLLASFTTTESNHNNSLQFAPTLEAGQTLPFLYSANFTPAHCTVYSFDSSYAATAVQTIGHNISTIPDGCNLQIGDDGHIWGAYLDNNDHYHFIKFRHVSVQEGDVTLTSADILDEWATTETFPYSTYVWQGMKVKRGKIWFIHAQTGSGKNRGVAIYKTGNHSYVGTWDLSYNDEEFEDMDLWGKDNFIIGTVGTTQYRLNFD